jgi:hypothetical protein
MMWIVFFVLLPIIVIIGGILFFNIYMRKKIMRDMTPKPVIDEAYLEAEQTHGDDEDFGSMFGKKQAKEE